MQKNSLKTELQNLIKSYYPSYCPVEVVEAKTKELGRKISNAERRLRKSESSNIFAVKKRNYIIGYQWVEPIMPKIEINPTQPVLLNVRRSF